MKYKNDEPNQYDDIILLPHHVSPTHPQMPISERAAQFSPFAALTGHRAAVKETARLTSERAELDEDAKELLNEKLRIIWKRLAEHPKLTITYFKQDDRKAGGRYLTITGPVNKLDISESYLLMMDGLRISICDIYEVEGELFNVSQ